MVKTYTDAMLKMDVHQKSPFAAGAKIIAPNHPSTTDPFFIAAMLGQQSYIMIKDVLFNVPVLGEYLKRSGHIKVAAGHGQEAIDQALAHLTAGHTIMIFPEGKISPLSGGYNQVRSGVARQLRLESDGCDFLEGRSELRPEGRPAGVRGKRLQQRRPRVDVLR